MEFDLSTIQMSRNDLKRGLRLPSGLTEALAEDIGIMVGDGHIGVHKNSSGINYQITVSGNAKTDFEYITKYIKSLKAMLYNLHFKTHYTGKTKSEIRLQLYSKGLLEFYKKLGLPIGNKYTVRIPTLIRKSDKNIKAAFARGLTDTDGYLRLKKLKNGKYYPRIKIVSASKQLIEDLKILLGELNFQCSTSYNLKSVHIKTHRESISHELYINGSKQVELWLKTIGFSNSKNNLRLERFE